MMEFLAQVGPVLLGILLLGILVAVHEFGHFMAARLTGIEVMEFAIGMGPKIVGWTGKKGTKFSLRWIPFGGFCAFYGEDDVEGKAKDDPRAYNKQPVWKRIITVAMGPMMNFILAIVVAVCFFWCTGALTAYPVIGSVEAGSPAEIGGVLPGDLVLALDGKDMGVLVEDIMGMDAVSRLSGFSDTVAASEPGKPMTLTVLRWNDETQRAEEAQATAATFWDEELQKNRIGIGYGIALADETRTPVGFAGGIRYGWNMCVSSGTAVFDALSGIFTSSEVRESVTGPVGAVDVVRQSISAAGAPAFFALLVMISVNLGIMNLLPIPGLDGSRLIFHIVEGVRRKPIKQEVEGMIHLVGTMLLLGLLALLTFRDVGRLF